MAIDVMRNEEVLAVPPSKISWGAIFGGAVAALGIWILLYAFGLAVGLTSINPQNPGSARGSGIFTGIWSVVTPLIALFIGGQVAGRGAGVTNRLGGATHGLVMWGLTTLLGAFLLMSFLGTVVRGAASTVGGAASAIGGGAGQVAEKFGLNADDALASVNQRLQQEGKPAITADQLQASIGDVVKQGAASGKIDRAALVQSLAQNTALSQADAEEVATRVEGQFAQFKQRLGGNLQQLQTGALQAAETTGKAFFGIFGALLLGLIAAVIGGLLGVSRRQQQSLRGTPEVRREVPASPYRPTEAHP